MKKFTNFSGNVAMASLPLAFGSMLNKAYGRTSSLNDLVTDTLNFALKLEYLEAEFYTKVVGSPGYLTASAADQTALTKIRNDENLHVAFLKGALGASAIAKPNIDLTGGGSAAGCPRRRRTSRYASHAERVTLQGCHALVLLFQ